MTSQTTQFQPQMNIGEARRQAWSRRRIRGRLTRPRRSWSRGGGQPWLSRMLILMSLSFLGGRKGVELNLSSWRKARICFSFWARERADWARKISLRSSNRCAMSCLLEILWSGEISLLALSSKRSCCSSRSCLLLFATIGLTYFTFLKMLWKCTLKD